MYYYKMYSLILEHKYLPYLWCIQLLLLKFISKVININFIYTNQVGL